jgi:ribosome-associated translation inhibitor RaiA
MQIDVRISGRNARVNDLRDYIERELRSAIGDFLHHIASLKVAVFDVMQLDGIQTRCRLHLELQPSGITLSQETRSTDAYFAVDQAVGLVRRLFDRETVRNADKTAKTAGGTAA